MPVSGPLRAVDTKVLGIDLERTRVYGSALDRYVFVSVDSGDGHDEKALDFIERSGGDVTRLSAAAVTAESLESIRAEKRSLDTLLLHIQTDSPVADSITETLRRAAEALDAAAATGTQLVVTVARAQLPHPNNEDQS